MCHILHLKAGKLSTSLITHSPQNLKILDGKSCTGIDFPKLLAGFQKILLPNSQRLCDAEGMLERSKGQKIPILHPKFGDIDDSGKKLLKDREATEHKLHSSRYNCSVSSDQNVAPNNLQSIWLSSEGTTVPCCCGCTG